jgi:putative phage-type endonuclease
MSTELQTGASAPLDLTTISREDWLAARGLGSSDSSAICGLNEFSTPWQVWAEKVGLVEPFAGNEATEIGAAMEPVITCLYAKRTGHAIGPVNAMYRHPKFPFITSTPDRSIYLFDREEARLGELKNVGWRMVRHWEDNNTPDHAHIQVQHQLMVCERFVDADVIALLGGRELAIRTIEPDLKVQARLIEILCEFWELVKTKTPPPLVAEDAEAIKKLYPNANSAIEIALPEDAEFLLEQRAKAMEQIKSATSIKDEAETKIKALLGNAERGKGQKFAVSWKNQTRAAHMVKESTFRKLTVTEVK